MDFDNLHLALVMHLGMCSAYTLSLYLASSAGTLSCFQELLEGEKGRQEMLSLEDRWGRTPLLLATSNGNTEVIVSYEDCDDAHCPITGGESSLGEGCFNQGVQSTQRNPSPFLC